MEEVMKVYCCECKKEIEPRLKTGAQMYPHREDLYKLLFLQCIKCKNFVGVHKGTTNPLGVIANQEIKNMRKKIHAVLDPIWKSGKIKRNELYKQLSDFLGWKYHTANIKSMDQAKGVYLAVQKLSENI
jgi:hypothetical protein